ncbi:response regulator [Fuerstiella marisgermanici]|uniref:Response regulator PleD n=1 Tax=Fuerstiella marisgermanici TaxID=1891926 RepID=A0A1P8WI75_9PLAN|nr:response regulator [Fuerstiella marisgermanici]APZ93765.1 response regulator PleD [Fuerstiella marisgermanici]
MNTKPNKILIVDDDQATQKTIVDTIVDTDTSYVVATTNDAGLRAVQNDSEISQVIIRAWSIDIDALDFCERIRLQRSHDDLRIIVILRNDERPLGAQMLIAGANDLLIGDFEPRELRMRAHIVPSDQVKRVDPAHTPQSAPDVVSDRPKVHVPAFDAVSCRFTFGHNELQIAEWEADPDVKKIPLDKIIVCPQCSAVPTFRAGCGECGGAWTVPETIIHHYACAHVAPEQEFYSKSGLACPKCRLTDLVAGSDFEQMRGCLKCSDCSAILSELSMVGHCLACEHRFAMADGIEMEIYGYQIGRALDAASVTPPNFHSPRRVANADQHTWQPDTVGSYSI